MDTDPVAYWNAQARDYDENIFSTIDEDATGVITQTIRRFAATDVEGPMGRCIDLGCGAGKYLHALSSSFKTVTACDLSPRLTSLARKEVDSRGLRNVSVKVRDLSQVWYRDVVASQCAPNSGDAIGATPDAEELGSYGFAVMANVLIAPGPTSTRTLMLRNAMRSLCPGGRLLVVVPSLESALYVNLRCEEAECDGPYAGGKKCSVTADLVRQPTRSEGADILQGVLKRSGVRTKHYLEPEFILLANRVGFAVECCEKVTYRWHSELGLGSDIYVPTALREQAPLPWDWLFVLQKEEHASGSAGSSILPRMMPAASSTVSGEVAGAAAPATASSSAAASASGVGGVPKFPAAGLPASPKATAGQELPRP